MSVLAKASHDEIIEAWSGLKDKPAFTTLRPAETGLVMVQARTGGTGQRFNLGEVTVTRSIIKLSDGTTGYAWVVGTNAEHAEIAAIFDALLCTSSNRQQIMNEIVQPLRAKQDKRKQETQSRTAGTRVDFFTMVRGEDE